MLSKPTILVHVSCALLLIAAWGSGCSQDDSRASDGRSKPTQAGRDRDAGESMQDAGAADAGPARIHRVPAVPLSAVWGSGPGDVWAVGGEGVILHYDGDALTVVESGTTSRLQAVAGTGPTDMWAAGDEGVTLHWDGARFEKVFEAASETVLGVWPNARDDVWFVGVLPTARAALVRHWNGEEWSSQAVRGAASLWEVWASTPEDLWFVGTSNDFSGLIYRGDGQDFTSLEFEGAPLRGIWGSGRDDVWLLPYESPPQHWDGNTLSSTEPQTEVGMLGTWGSSSEDVWAVGHSGTILHYDGSTWSAVESPTEESLSSVWGSAPDDVWAAGGNGTLLRWNGKSWRVFAQGSPDNAASL